LVLRHEKTQSGENPCECLINVGKPAGTSTGFQMYERTHTEEKPYNARNVGSIHLVLRLSKVLDNAHLRLLLWCIPNICKKSHWREPYP
jgi:hypothetical protein